MRPLYLNLARLLGVTLPAVLGSTSYAQSTPGQETLVVTATRTLTPLSQLGSIVTVLGQEQIQTSQAITVTDLLEKTPGITVARSGGPGQQTSLFLRGADSDQTLVLIDGIKLNDPSEPGGSALFSDLLTGELSRIEIVRGPQSVIWGSQAIGGVINLITRKGVGPLSASIEAEGGSLGTGRGRAQLSGGSDRVDYAIGGQYYRTDGVSALDSVLGGRERDGYRAWGANGKIGFAILDNVHVDVRGWYTNSRVEFDNVFSQIDTNDSGDTRQLALYSGLEADFLDGRFHNQISIAYSRFDRDYAYRSFSGEFSYRGDVIRLSYQGVGKITSGVELIVGAEREETDYRAGDNFGSTPLRTSASINSGYGQLQASPLSGLTLNAGIRYDDHDAYGGETTVRFTMSYTPDAGATIIRASYGEGFKAPSLDELYGSVGNATLQPEKAKAGEIGVERQFLGGKATLGTNLFYRNTQDQIAYFSCFGSLDTRCRTGVFGFLDNIQRARVWGLEVIGRYQVTDALLLSGNYTFLDTEDRSDIGRNRGRELARRPRHSGTVTAEYQWPIGLTTGLSARLVGRSFDNTSNSIRLGGYTLLNVTARYPVSEHIELFGRIENLLDQNYETVGGYGTPGLNAFAGVRMKL